MGYMMRSALCCAAGLWLAGCSPFAATSYETLQLAVLGQPSQISAEYVHRLNRPALIVQAGQSEALMLLASRHGAISEWHGLDQHLVARNGKLVHSAGLPAEADITVAAAAAEPFEGDLRTLTNGFEVVRLVDYPARYLTGVPQRATYERGPLEQLEVMGRSVELMRLDETVSSPILDFKAVNHYWLDPQTGRVIASEQTLAPGLPALFLTEVAPPGVTP